MYRYKLRTDRMLLLMALHQNGLDREKSTSASSAATSRRMPGRPVRDTSFTPARGYGDASQLRARDFRTTRC